MPGPTQRPAGVTKEGSRMRMDALRLLLSTLAALLALLATPPRSGAG